MNTPIPWGKIIFWSVVVVGLVIFVPRCSQWRSHGCDVKSAMVYSVTHGSPSTTEYCVHEGGG